MPTMPPNPLNLLWLQSGGCGGCTLSLLNAEQPHLFAHLEHAGIRLLWHPSLSQESGAEALDILAACAEGRERLDILCVEGSIMTGPHGSGRFHMLSGTGRPMMSWVLDLAVRAPATCWRWAPAPPSAASPRPAATRPGRWACNTTASMPAACWARGSAPARACR
jgi:Ni,Fe-hydrogenase I small subunit